MKKILLIVLLLTLSTFLLAQEIAIFTKIQGAIYSDIDSIRVFYRTGNTLVNNTQIMTDIDSYALLHYKFTNGTLRVFPNSTITITSLDSLNTKVNLAKGKILNDLKDKITGSYTIETNSTVASVRGTKFEVSLTNQGTQVSVIQGNVDVLNKISGKTHSLSANQSLISSDDGQIIEKAIEKTLPDRNQEQGKQESGSRSIDVGPISDLMVHSQEDIVSLEPGFSPDPRIFDRIQDSYSASVAIPIEDKETSSGKPAVVVEKKEAADLSPKRLRGEAPNEDTPIAVVLKIKGNLTLLRGQETLECPVGTLLRNSDIVRTDDQSLALIKMVDNSSKIRVFSNSQVLISASVDNELLNKELKLETGSILSTVNNKIAGKYSVSTTSTIASVRGTEFLVELIDGVTKVTGFSGKVEVENKKSKEKSLVTKGNTVTSTEDGQIDRRKTESVPEEVDQELETIEYENTMKIQFENEEGEIKTIILEY